MRVAAVVASATIYALALPPVDLGRLAWIALVPLLLAIRGRTAGAAFRYGCLFGYLSGWMVLWPLVDAASGYLAIPSALATPGVALWFLLVVGVPFGLFAAGAAIVMGPRSRVSTPLMVAAMWVACEILRGRVLGQPWGLLGYTQHRELAILQVAAVTGVYGISFLLAMASAGIALGLAHAATEGRPCHVLRLLVLPAALTATCWLLGDRMLRDAPLERTEQPRPVAIVQSNVVPPLEWNSSYTAAQISTHLRETDEIAADVRPALIVWPEYAVPRYVEADPGLASLLGGTARHHHADLLFGTPRYENGRSFNSARLVRSDGRDGGHYDKRRLVLFAERKPLRREADVFAEGVQPGVLTGFARLGVSICHEIIHPDLIADSVRHGAQLLVNLANDSWLDRTSEAAGLQHLAMASFRAVETHRYLIRAAMTGASAVFDPFGRTVAVLPTGQRGILTAEVAPRDRETWYVRYGDAFGGCCVVLAFLGLAVGGRWIDRLGWAFAKAR